MHVLWSLIWRCPLTVLCHLNIPVTARATHAKHQLSKIAVVDFKGGGGVIVKKQTSEYICNQGVKNIPWKQDPSAVKVVRLRLLFSAILVCQNFATPLVATFCTILSADEEKAAVTSNLKLDSLVYFSLLATYFIRTKSHWDLCQLEIGDINLQHSN